MAKKNYDQLAKDIVKYVGGTSNVISLVHCMTRLRFKLKNPENVDKQHLSQLSGVIKVIESGGQTQVVIGNHVADVFDAIFANTDLKQTDDVADAEPEEKKNLLSTFMDTVSGIFVPVLGAMSAAALLKALLILFTTIGVLDTATGTYRILYAAADGVFNLLPLFLAYTAGKKFKANEFLAVAVAAALVYPDISSAYSSGESLTFLGIPVILVSYTSTVIPIILSTYVQSKLEKLINKFLPDTIKRIFGPMITLTIIVPLSFLVIGPVSDWAGKLLAAGYTGLVGLNPIIAGGLLGLIWPLAVMFGVHWGFVPIVMNNIATLGYDTLFTITGPNNMAQAGATLGVFLKTKNKELKELSGPAALSAVLSGVTEPAIYGVTLRFKKPFFIGAVFSGIGGAIVAAAGTGVPALIGTSLLSLPAYLYRGTSAFVGFVIACAIAYFGAAIVTYLFGYSDDMLPKTPEQEPDTDSIGVDNHAPIQDEVLIAPVNGKSIPLSEVKDEAFAGEVLGKGAAIIPTDGKFYAPCDGTIMVMYPTGHAIIIRSEKGADILIHIGMDTVGLNGEGFTIKVSQGMKVKAGDLLVEADLDQIKAAGLDITTPVVITNSDEYEKVEYCANGQIDVGLPLITCTGKKN